MREVPLYSLSVPQLNPASCTLDLGPQTPYPKPQLPDPTPAPGGRMAFELAIQETPPAAVAMQIMPVPSTVTTRN